MTRAGLHAGSLCAAKAVLFERHHTLVFDLGGHNGHPLRVAPIPGAARAIDVLRRAGLRVGIVGSHCGIGGGSITPATRLEAVNRRIDELFGPFDTWRCCPHTPTQRCACHTSLLIQQAAADLAVAPDEVILIGDGGLHMQAAAAAGAMGILVPSQRTCIQEMRTAPVVAQTLPGAAGLVVAARATVVARP